MSSSTTTAAREGEWRLRQTIARNTKAERKALDLSGVETAARCGLNLRHLQKIESRELNITLATLAALSVGLGIEATDLMRERPPDQKGATVRGVYQANTKARRNG